MNIKNILSKTMPSIIVIALMLLSGSMIVMVSNASPSGTASFAFPYSYGTPTIPKDVGAQGIQGPTVPVNKIGPQNFPTVVGAKTNVGPTGFSTSSLFKIVESTVVITVYNGTAHPLSRSAAVNVYVNLTNDTFGKIYSLRTNTSGKVSFTVPEGYYILSISPLTSTYTEFYQLLDVNSTSLTLTRYLIPSSYGTTIINNGGVGTMVIQSYLTFDNTPLPQVNISITNQSSTNDVIGTATSLSNGSVIFTKLDTTYKYGITVAYTDGLTGMSYCFGNYTGANDLTFSGNTLSTSIRTSPNNSYGSSTTITGTALPSNNFFWCPSVNTTVSGGTLVLGSDPAPDSGIKLTLQNMNIIYGGEDVPGSGGTVIYSNDTVISLGSSIFGGGDTPDQKIYFNNSVYIGSSLQAWSSGASFIFKKSNDSYIFLPTNYNSRGSDTILGGNWTNDIMNGSFTSNSHLFVGDLNLSSSEIIDMQDADPGGFASTVNLLWKCDLVLNSNFQSPYTSGTLTIKDTRFSNSSFSVGNTAGINWINDNLSLSFNFTTQIYAFIAGNNIAKTYMNMSNTYLTVASWSNLTAYAKNAGTRSGDANIWTGTYFNVSCSNWNFSANKHFNVTVIQNLPNVNIGIGNAVFYNDIISNNYTQNQLSTWNQNLSGHPMVYGMFKILLGTNDTITHSVLNMDDGELWQESNGSITHTVFETQATFNAYGMGTQMFESPMNYTNIAYSYSNDSFEYFIINKTLENIATHFVITDYSTTGSTWIQDHLGGSTNVLKGWLNISHNTFYAIGGAGNEYTNPSGLISAVTYNVFTNVTSNIFWNSYAYDIGNKNYFLPYVMDVGLQSGPTTVSDNYFLNLNNRTMPISSQIDQSQPVANKYGDNATIYNNHYYFSPYNGESFVPINGATFSYQNLSSPLDFMTELPLSSTQTYEITSAKGGNSLLSSSGDQYIYNTSRTQVPTAQFPNSPTYVWQIAPDVNTSSGTPVISYQNGLVAGPQPNFEWHGYNYSESVEPSYIKIGVNSSKAPDVVLQYNNLYKKTLYIAYIYTNGVIYKDWAFNSNSSSTYNVTYDPATMPLDPTIVVIPWTPTSPNPPPLTPIIVNAGNNILQFIEQPYVLIPLIILIVAAVVLVSTGRRKY